MFVDRLVFSEVDEICAKILPILLNNNPKVESLLKNKTVVMVEDYIEVVLYLPKGIASIYLTDFSFQTSWKAENISTAIHEYRVLMAKNKKFNAMVKGKEVNKYIQELDLFLKKQYLNLYQTEIETVVKDSIEDNYQI